MNQRYSASTLISALLILITILTVIYLNKDNLFVKHSVGLNIYQQYLKDKFQLVDKIKLDHQKECETQQKTIITFEFNSFNYTFNCKLHTLILQKKFTDKYANIENLAQLLDLERFDTKIITIQNLNDLPQNSEQDPQIVIINNPIIEQRLLHNFYGIVITKYPLVFTGEAIHGMVIAPIEQKVYIKASRYIKHNQTTLQHLNEKYSKWFYLPHSKNILND